MLLNTIGMLYARGTHSGTAIVNQTHITYASAGITRNFSSNIDTFVVDKVVDIQIDWEDAAAVTVSAGDSDRVLTFVVSNLGNSDDNITLGHEHNATSDFVPTHVRIFLDDGDGVFDSNDTLVSHVSLPADTNATLFLLGDIPDNNTTAPTHRSLEAIRATTESNATAGADRPGQIDTVIRHANDIDTGIWEIRDYWLVAKKHAIVYSEDNATHTGTRITYTITYAIGGNAVGKTIQNVILTDTIPPGTRYVTGSLRQDGTPRTDAVDGDNADCNGTQIRLNAGTITGTTQHTFAFDVRVR